MGGFWGKVLMVDLTHLDAQVADVGGDVARKFLGARGLAARYYWDLVGRSCDPMSADNVLVFFCGPLTGTKVPCSTKMGLATRSPMTGLYTCSNAGGNFGPRLKAAGFDGLIVTGAARRPTLVHIRGGDDERGYRVRFLDAEALWGLTAPQTVAESKRIAGDPGASVACIGPAGENLVAFACVQADTRSFGRGGAGAVMGSKNLKAIVVSGKLEAPVADRKSVAEVASNLTRRTRDARPDLRDLGTGQLTEVMNSFGCYPTRNFRTAVFEGAGQIGAARMKRDYWARNTTCYRCPIACGKLCTVRSGPHAGASAEPEYESVWALGAQCGVSDFGCVLRALQFCDEAGLDAMSAGYLAGMCMDLYEDAVLSSRETGGSALRFGDGDALLSLLESMAGRVGLGGELAPGLTRALETHPHWEPYAMHVKGSPFAGYDPRGFHGIGLSYGTSSRGACHNVGGWTISDELTSGRYDRYALEGKGGLVKSLQDVRAYVDSLGVCTNARRPLGFSDTPTEVVLKAVTGIDLTPGLVQVGERIYNLERLLLVREGVRRADDLLPERMSVPLPSGPAAGHCLSRADYDVMLEEYYSARGWDSEGVPVVETSARLGLSEFGERSAVGQGR